jgi:hypothetical protein
MSSKAGPVLVVYQGWLARRAVMIWGRCPWRAYQMMTRAWMSSAIGTVRSTAGAGAGLAGAQDVASVGEGLLDGPSGGVAGDQGGGGGVQVGGYQGEQPVAAVFGEDDADGAGAQAAVPQAGDGGKGGGPAGAVGVHGAAAPAGGGGELGGGCPAFCP